MPASFARGNRLALAGVMLLVFGATSFGIWYYLQPHELEDALLQKTFAGIASIATYTQSVETEINLSDRNLVVRGEYYLNGPENRFQSIATTTLRVPQGRKIEEHSFTLQNISIGDDIYSKIETESPLLQETIPHSANWRHFTKGHIPDEFADIAVSGPILDNLLLFSQGGAFLVPRESYGEEMLGAERLARYSFTLSESVRRIGGTLGTLVGRIGESGRVDVWIDPSSATLRQAVFTGENYHSTTTFSAMNIPHEIRAPIP